MGRSVFATALVATALLTVQLPAGVAQNCFNTTGCDGDIIMASTMRECCAGTDDGMSWETGPGECSECIVHGFNQTEYFVEETRTLPFSFEMFTKGTPIPGVRLNGFLFSEDITATSGPDNDYNAISRRSTASVVTGNPLAVEMSTLDDDICLEIDDRVALIFEPNAVTSITQLEAAGHFVRVRSTVHILDNDPLAINFALPTYSLPERTSVLQQNLTLQFRRTATAFQLTLHPITITNALDPAGFNVSRDFLPDMFSASEQATLGDDFRTDTITITVPATEFITARLLLSNITVPSFLRAVDDELNEFNQNFAVVGEVILPGGVAANFSCFRTRADDNAMCHELFGATTIRIEDDDPMRIGFVEEGQTLVELNDVLPGNPFPLIIPIMTSRLSENEYEVEVRWPGLGNATVVVGGNRITGWDFEIGTDIVERFPTNSLIFMIGQRDQQVVTNVNDDFISEDTECLIIQMNPRDADPNFPETRTDFECFSADDMRDSFLCEHTVCIIDNDDPLEISYERTVYTVTEGDPAFDICVNLTQGPDDLFENLVFGNAYHLPGRSRHVPIDAVIAMPDNPDFLGRYPMADRTDYQAQLQDINVITTLPFTEIIKRQCWSQVAYDDLRLEATEWAGLTLTVLTADIRTNVGEGESSIVIIDNDVAVVGLERTFYSVNESVGVVEVCAIVYEPDINCPIEFPFDVSLSTRDGTAVTPMDYVPVSTILMFAACETRQCVDIPIVNDLVDEPDERFGVTLERTPGLDSRISLNPIDGIVEIVDDDIPITVGYEFTVYTTTETMGSVELCAIIYDPPSGIAPRDFSLSASTEDGTADAPDDYVAVVAQMLQFNEGDTRSCHTIIINQDLLCENDPNEDFFSNLVLSSGIQPITVDPPRARVIIDDSDENDCASICVGYERLMYTTTETIGFVELCAIIYERVTVGNTEACTTRPSTMGTSQPFVLSASTEDGTAVAPGDYVAVVGHMLQFNTGDLRVCHTVTIQQDDVCENNPNELFFSNLMLTSGVQLVTVNRPQTQVTIDDSREPECEPILVNDTLTGDPLMTVPIFSDPDVQPGDVVPSLCYEVHGEADKFFNLVSDTCVSVNARYSDANINKSLNIVSAIGVRAVDNNGSCQNINVGLEGCQASINGMAIDGMYRSDGVYVREFSNRVRITVPNCEDTNLVMWVFCTSGITEDDDWKNVRINFIRFVVMRGLNLAEESHGIIGQFWNVPVDLAEYIGTFGDVLRNDDYIITVNSPGSSRSFVGIRASVTWEFERRPCLYVGNSQAGPLGEEDVTPNDSVIEGSYGDYEVDTLYSSDFTYSHFNEALCDDPAG